MTKADIIAKLAETAGTTKAQAAQSFDGLLKIIEDALKKEGKITLTGFGTFEVAKRAARDGRNPRTGDKIKIPASKVIKFKPGKLLKDTIQGNKKK